MNLIEQIKVNDVSIDGYQGTYYSESPEWVRVIVDSEDKVLAGIKLNGTVEWSVGIPTPVRDYVEDKLKDIDFNRIDSSINELYNIKVDKEDNKGLIDSSIAESVSYSESSEWLQVTTDSEDKILLGIKTNGTVYIPILENDSIDLKVDDAIERIDASVNEALSNIGALTDYFSEIDDPEGRSLITTDSEQKIISYRDNEGILHENVGIKTNSLIFTEDGMTDFQQALKDAGFQPGGPGDFSDSEQIELPEPKHYGMLNLIIDALPVEDSDISRGYAEYYDFYGNYFKKECELAAQGQSSRIFARTGAKGNYTLDLPLDIKFGHWVPQDSFHLKGNYRDVTRGILPTSYKYAYLIQNYLNAKANRVLVHDDNITTQNGTGDRMTDWSTDARCLPDGFPIEVYVNGIYWGIYSLQLKKHRKNYSMDKKDYTSFFLDTEEIMSSTYDNGFWTGDIWWNKIDIKNPKDLICKDGSKFDGDNPKELISARSMTFNKSQWKYVGAFSSVEPENDIWDAETNYHINDECWCYDEDDNGWMKFKAKIDNTSIAPIVFEDNLLYDSSNKAHKGSAQTRKIIKSYPVRYLKVKALIEAGNINEAKELFNDYFDYNACMLVYIFNCMMKNGDSIMKNTLWGIYGNGKICPMLWDLDGMYGTQWNGTRPGVPSNNLWNVYATATWPLSLFYTLYKNDIKTTYQNLRRDKIIDMDVWKSIMYDSWINRIGEAAFKRDIDRWPETPSYRKDMLNSDYWVEISSNNNLPIWDDSTEYQVGDEVRIIYNGISGFYSYRAKVQNTNQCPVTKYYNLYPIDAGYFDTPKRMEKWMSEQLRLSDIFNEYNN